MIPEKRKIDYEKCRTDDFTIGVIESIVYDMEHKSVYKGEAKVGPCVQLIFTLEGYKFPHKTPFMTFSYGEKSNLYKKYVSALVEGATPDMQFDLDQIKGMKVKILWKDKGDYQHVDVIRPADAKIVPVLGLGEKPWEAGDAQES